MRGRCLLLGACLLCLLQLAALPSPPWRSLRPGIIATVAGGRALPASLAAGGLAFYGATGLTADLFSGALYVLDTSRGMVFRIEPGGTGAEGTGTESTVTPWAGRESAGFNGDGRPGLETSFHAPSALALDPRTGEIFVADTQNHRIRAVAADGQRVRTVAGLGVRGVAPESLPSEPATAETIARGHFSGDGGAAVDAELNYPSGVAVDGLGILFLADSGNHRVRVVNRGTSPVVVCAVEVRPGEIRTVAGTGAAGLAGDGGQAREALLSFPTELDLDATGNVYVLDSGNGRIRKIDRLTGRIGTVAASRPAAGGSIAGLGITSTQEIVYSNRLDGSLHVVDRGGEDRVIFTAGREEARLGSVAIGRGDVIYLADEANHRVLVVAGGRATTFAGGAAAPSRVPLKEAEFSELGPVAVDAFGNVFLADAGNHAVRRILMAERVVETLMGTGTPGSGGDGGPPHLAELSRPTDILLDGDWNFYITDQWANLVRRVSMTNDGLRVATFAGDLGATVFAEGRAATATRLAGPLRAARHPGTGEIYISCEADHSLRKVDAQGRLSTVAGTGEAGFGGDGGPARDARLQGPTSIAFDQAGGLYFADRLNHRIRWIDAGGRIRTFAGTGVRGYAGDGGPAEQAELSHPDSLLFDGEGNLYFADTNNHSVRRILAASHQIETVVGNGVRGYAGDGGPARAAQLNLPRGLAFSHDGFLYITDSLNRRLRAVKLPL